MARLWSSGLELQSLTSNMEVGIVSGGSISTTTTRSGSAASRLNPSSAFVYIGHQFSSSAVTTAAYLRFYLRIATAPGSDTELALVYSTATTSRRLYLQLTSSRKIKVVNASSVQVGSDSSALSLNTWYRVELFVDGGNSTVIARIDGSDFVNDTATSISAYNAFTIGTFWASGTYDIGVEDIAINDTSGSFQNSWPGEGEIIHLRPNAAGDNADWTRAGSDSGANWSQVDEVPPNDATDVNKTGTLDAIDDYNLDATPAALASDDTINCVQVGARFRVENTTGDDPAVVFRIKASASGTVEESAAITATTNVWGTNAMANPRNYPLTLYDLPGASTTAWTKSDLDTTQIGARISTGDTHPVQLSTMWLLVDHKPTSGGGGEVTYISTRMMRGLG